MSYINDNGFTTSKQYGQLRDLSSQLILHGKLVVTENTGKKLQTFIEPLVTLAKRGDLHSRRMAIAKLRKITTKESDKDVVIQTLFTTIAQRYQDRNGGYTKLIKINPRAGDNAKMVIITFV
ncbi:50S ribosomal protein L17 [Spiroplasma platyhelix]|uniref:50S ribosomal protein L17 n=1 Tax=Spiroplasma platyhelix PALS-1 TaxID=1276218 RepID=A0A846U5E4_9MOLU|nr:50S ribosomal protein L17 [Spiroplasma platyhelix]MBE4704305.1 50S ribosomal protein L17 [Spiroplasma platyhelix PALS-1]NKE38677.1 50S ribosomal protein L17 [Spiroplasma platyhelix PALS-1]UJB28889.1 50S ribosomal protein L17 [Spiroplasma platyhelix PALS-1]